MHVLLWYSTCIGKALKRAVDSEVCRLVGTNLRREFAHAWNFQFKIPTRSVHMRGFSLQICALETTCKPLYEAVRYQSSEQPDENCVFLSEDFENDAEPLFRAPFFY